MTVQVGDMIGVRLVSTFEPWVKDAIYLARLCYLERAFAPVSSFRVGAVAICRTPDGNHMIFEGANYEEPAVNGTVHAEPCAVAHANARGFRDVETIVLCADDGTGGFVPPCFHCREILAGTAELVERDIRIVMVKPEGNEAKVVRLSEIAPGPFLFGHIGVDLGPYRPQRDYDE